MQTDHAITIDVPPESECGLRSRYHFRSRWVTSPWWFRVGSTLALVPADFVMSRDHLNGVKDRAERLAARPQPPEQIAVEAAGAPHEPLAVSP